MATLPAPTVDQITNAFPTPILPKIGGEPTREPILNIHRLLCQNASAIPTSLGGGNHGHLALTLNNAEYQFRTGNAFVAPVNPGDFAPPIPLGFNQQMAQQHLEQWRQQHRQYHTYNNCHKALKIQLAAAIEAEYLAAIKNDLIGFEGVSLLAMLAHLYDTYGDIDDKDIEENNIKMMKQYDPSQPLSVLIKQLEDGRMFAAAGNQTLTDDMLISKGITLLRQTAVFNGDICRWKALPAAEKTWENFKRFFHRVHKENRKATVTAGEGGYSATVNNIFGTGNVTVNNIAVHCDNNTGQILSEETTNNINMIADGILHHSSSIQELQQANAVLTNTNSMIMQQLQMIAAQLHQLQQNQQHTKPKQGSDRQNGFKYCWTCGRQKDHWSNRCPNPKEGHIKNVSFCNQKGGSRAGFDE